MHSAKPFTVTNTRSDHPRLLHHGGPAGAVCPSQRRRCWQQHATATTTAATRLSPTLSLVAAILTLAQWPTATPPVRRHVPQHVGCKHTSARTKRCCDAAATVGSAAEPAPLQLAVWCWTGPPRVAELARRRGCSGPRSQCVSQRPRGWLHGQPGAFTRPSPHVYPGCACICLYGIREPSGSASSSA
jgi:hypothetical protein